MERRRSITTSTAPRRSDARGWYHDPFGKMGFASAYAWRVSGINASRSFVADIQVGRRGVRWPFGRFVIGDEELTVRSSPTRWIRARSASRQAVGDISVYERAEIRIPILRGRRLDDLRFEDPGSPFFGVSLMLPRRTQIIEDLRARGYSVTDRRS